MSKSVAIALIHTTRLDCTKKCISHLRRTKGVRVHIFLLVQGPQDKVTEEYLNHISKYNRMTIIRNPTNTGGWRGRVKIVEVAVSGTQKVTGYKRRKKGGKRRTRKTKEYERIVPFPDYVLVIDNDVYVPPNWFTEMERAYIAAPPKTAGVGMVLDYGGKLYGGFDFGIDKNRVLYYRSIPPPYGEDLICDAAIDGAWMFPIENKWLFYTSEPRIPSPFFGYDNCLHIKSKGYKFVVCSGVVGEHTSRQDSGYTRMRYGSSGADVRHVYRMFMRKWNVRVSRRLWLKIIFPRKFPRIWRILKALRNFISSCSILSNQTQS